MKRLGKIAAGMVIAGGITGMCALTISNTTVFADETGEVRSVLSGSGQETSDQYKIEVINDYTYTEEQNGDNESVKRVVADKEIAAPGEAVTVTQTSSIGVISENRVRVIRSDSGQDVTEMVLGEHHSHFNSEGSLTFVMPQYDITIRADVIIGAYLGIPVPAFSEDPDLKLASVIQSPNGVVSVDADTLVKSDYDDSITLAKVGDTLKITATPDPGYVFKKWYIKCGVCNVAMTDDLDIDTTVDNETGVATGTLVHDGDIRIQAVFDDGTAVIPPTHLIGVPIHITYVDENGNDITDKINYSVLDADGKASDLTVEDNAFLLSFSSWPTDKTVYDGDVDGSPTYRIIYGGSFEQKTNIIRTEKLPEQYKPVDDLSLTTVLGDVNDKEGVAKSTVVSADNDKVKIVKAEDSERFYYDVIIPVDTKESTEIVQETGNKENPEKTEGEKDSTVTGHEMETNIKANKSTSSSNAGNDISSEKMRRNASGYVSSDKVTPIASGTKETQAPATGEGKNTAIYVFAAGAGIAASAFVLIKKVTSKKDKYDA